VLALNLPSFSQPKVAFMSMTCACIISQCEPCTIPSNLLQSTQFNTIFLTKLLPLSIQYLALTSLRCPSPHCGTPSHEPALSQMVLLIQNDRMLGSILKFTVTQPIATPQNSLVITKHVILFSPIFKMPLLSQASLSFHNLEPLGLSYFLWLKWPWLACLAGSCSALEQSNEAENIRHHT